MKKILVFLILTMFSVFSMMADEASVYTSTSIRVDSMQTVRLSVTTSNTVFLGVAANEVNSSILPDTIDSVTNETVLFGFIDTDDTFVQLSVLLVSFSKPEGVFNVTFNLSFTKEITKKYTLGVSQFIFWGL